MEMLILNKNFRRT